MSTHYIGQRLSFESQLCTVRYIGEVKGTKGGWLGVEWDNPSRGKHSGEHNGTRYFECKSPGAGSFVRPNRPSDAPNSFLSGLREKYITNVEKSGIPKPIEFGKKAVEEVGFDKVSKKFSELDTLTSVLLDYMRIKTCGEDTEEIAATCANLQRLDLTCNLFEEVEEVVKLCRSLPKLDFISINGNRFMNYRIGDQYRRGLDHIKTLKADDLRSSWTELFELVNSFTNVTDLSIAVGSIKMLTPDIVPRVSDLHIASRLESICLEEHAISSISGLADLQNLPCLRRLLLSYNKIKAVYSPAESKAVGKLCFPSVTYLDISHNEVSDWTFLDDMRIAFPKLDALRISHNPLYSTSDARTLTDESYQITVGRLGRLVTSLNYSVITPAERADAELFYISTIVKELSVKPAEQEAEILSRHTRWQELQTIHGEQTITRDLSGKSKDALASKLIEVEVCSSTKTVTKKFPRTVTIGKLSGLIGRVFGVNPLDITLYLIEDGIVDDGGGVRETLLADELRELDYYVTEAKIKLAVRDKSL
ncbi:hypothetical protein TWF730_001153 [Orbilia blumenaviensis]|uniref:Tubulin-specific chaperone E n=1 Tax=Orbilia blumenaviensis TaxID=1796055 RepID=A0AAV9VQR4_9PEZI